MEDNQNPYELGDIVEVIREPTQEERKEWSYWKTQMNETVGKVGRIEEIDRINFVRIYAVTFLENGEKVSWWYPPYLLKPASK